MVSIAPEYPGPHAQCLAQATETVRAKVRLKSMRTTDYHFRLFLALYFSEGRVSMPSTPASVAVVKAHSQHSPIFT